ncbi:TetR/AcrR family transcriptional regulator [Seonamhaeicola algicola]|uniref:TetR/AcrR family transcriptional regulator n=1 Tax=Seonamhaeicola algicola TaxID=1719036 RepID=A0A5C7AIC1_9FLAO|nr:TetR/AcrR family transcriptional regulator [Seonamhaeicola algicola]TXE06315.1 TetR/AcrR family transcriptional regulator [Seonamhaeicola algicola]
MPRKKQYIEAEVIDKAMHLFLRNGYSNTSIQALEKAMGINMFSIYARFGSKKGVFLACIKAYKEKSKKLLEDLKNADNGVEDIKQLFYKLANSNYTTANQNGCLIVNTHYEFAKKDDQLINAAIEPHLKTFKTIFIEKLRKDPTKNEATIQREANFLMLAKNALVTSCRVSCKNEIEDFIETTFKKI